MALADLNLEPGTILDLLPPELIARIESLVLLSKIAVIILLGYIVFLVIKQFYGWRRNVRINKMYYKIHEMDIKLDLILKKKNIKVPKEEKKLGFFSRFSKKNKKKKK